MSESIRVELPWPISLEDVRQARERIGPYLTPTPLRHYAVLDTRVGHGIQVFVKHENHNPTGSFKVRNGFAALTALGGEAARRGVVAASRGNHGQGLALAGATLGVPVVICVPEGNNPEKNEAMAGFGAELVESFRDGLNNQIGRDLVCHLLVTFQPMHKRGLRCGQFRPVRAFGIHVRLGRVHQVDSIDLCQQVKPLVKPAARGRQDAMRAPRLPHFEDR